MIAQAALGCKVHHTRLTRQEVKRGTVVWRAATCSACSRQNDSFWVCGQQFPIVGVPVFLPLVVRLCSVLPVGVPVFLPLVPRTRYARALNRRPVLAEAGDWVSHYPLLAAQCPYRHAMRGISPSRWGISFAALQWRLISQCVASARLARRPGWGECRKGRGRHGPRGTTRESPAPRGAHRPKGGPSPLQRGPLARRCGRAAPETPIHIMARQWVPWVCRRGTLSLWRPQGAHTARPYACLPGGSTLP